MELVNLDNIRQAPVNSMVQMVKCVQSLIALLDNNYDPVQTLLFPKMYIKDGFWILAVSDKDAWNFFYVLPQTTPVTNIYD